MIARVLWALSLSPPPLVFVAALVLGLRLDAARPWALVADGGGARAVATLGVALMAAGALFAASAIGLFVRHRTTIVPHHRSRALVTGGPFRVTRNPMYVASAAVYVGVALHANALWPLLLLALPLAFLQFVTIPREEALLRAAFADEYPSYAARVRRWL